MNILLSFGRHRTQYSGMAERGKRFSKTKSFDKESGRADFSLSTFGNQDLCQVGWAREVERLRGNTTLTCLRSEAILNADELSKAADVIKWPRPPELAGLEKIAGHIVSTGYYCMDDHMDASVYERPR